MLVSGSMPVLPLFAMYELPSDPVTTSLTAYDVLADHVPRYVKDCPAGPTGPAAPCGP